MGQELVILSLPVLQMACLLYSGFSFMHVSCQLFLGILVAIVTGSPIPLPFISLTGYFIKLEIFALAAGKLVDCFIFVIVLG